jgi:hypothetical protein
MTTFIITIVIIFFILAIASLVFGLADKDVEKIIEFFVYAGFAMWGFLTLGT